ncbi:hypothetical protein ONE63_005797 [Megalurothrips usitatus]|uniref:G domain-containing protein n=1 Tax=Megalurothrips usitatus TaxID=439358 RepID=A0AAV7Y1K2_9NEOP|nr:hypothetical protein ONE63_005797 [Megalurothrips usitatus]
MLPVPLVVALLSIGLAGASPGGAGAGAALLSGRLLGPRHHVRLTARLQLDDHPRHPRAVCLRVDKGPPLFKFALPVESEDDRRLADADAAADPAAFNCSTSGDPAVEDLLKSLDFSTGNLQRSLCNGAAALLRHYATGAPGPSQGVLKAQCTPTADSAAVSLRGRLDDEQVAASLQLRHEGRARAVPRAGAVAKESSGQQRRRRAHGNEVDELQRCVAEGYSLAMPADVGGDVILVLGLTGSGKSTLVQFIADNDENLVSYETTADSGDFLIGDHGNKIASGVDSKTRVPELVRDRGSKSKLYDFPGFGDSRGACADIVTASVLRQVAQSARSVKVVFVISYHSARAGSDRLGFVSLLRHATTFVRDLAKYNNSVSLVVTKIQVPTDDVDEDSISESAAAVRETVASFLRQVKETLVDLERTGSDPAAFYPGADAMVSAILQQENDGAYSRIGVFWKPDEAGPLRNITLMQQSKPDLQNMIYR